MYFVCEVMAFTSANLALSNYLVWEKISEHRKNNLMCKRRFMKMHTKPGVNVFYYFMLFSQVLITQEASHPTVGQSILM